MKKFLLIVNSLLQKFYINAFLQERVFIIFVITSLTVIWFRKGLILGSGESGLPFYNTQRLLDTTSHIWSDTPLGGTSAIGAASLPFYTIINFLLKSGLPGFLVQAFVYWFIFLCGALSIHQVSTLIHNNNRLTRLSSSLFYIFNPIVHVAVLHRFQYPMLFFYGFIPLGFLIYFYGLTKRKYIYIILLNTLTLFFSFMFVGPAFFLLLILVFGLLSLSVFCIFLTKKKLDLFPILYFVLFILTFVLLHLWWFYPLVTPLFSSQSTALRFFNPSGNVDTFLGISKQLQSVASVFRMFPIRFYEGNGSVWGWLYYSPLFVILSFIYLTAYIASLFRKQKQLIFLFFVFLSLVVMFLMKGALPPLGGIFLFFISKLSPLQVFRNPFEKIGLLLPFALAIPVGLGIDMIADSISKKFKESKLFVSVILLVLIFPVYMFPIVNGLVFTGGAKPADDIRIGQYVKVPDYYTSAREWFNANTKEPFRVLALPINGEGMTYVWDYGYSGVELSNNIFDQPFISYSTGQSFLEDMVNTINKYLLTSPENLWSLAQAMNIKYFMVREDIDYKERRTLAPLDVTSIIEKLYPNIKNSERFGRLNLFEIEPRLFESRIYVNSNPVLASDPFQKTLELIPFYPYTSHDLLVTPITNLSSDRIYKFVLVRGNDVKKLKLEGDGDIPVLPFVRFGPGHILNKLVRLKEALQLKTIRSPDLRVDFRSSILGKRVAEMQQSPSQRKSILKDYKDELQSFSKDYINSHANSQEAMKNLLLHKNLLSDLSREDNSVSTEVQTIVNEIDELLKKTSNKPQYTTQRERVLRFDVPIDGLYDVLIAKEDWSNYYNTLTNITLDLDGKPSEVNMSDEKTALNLGNFFLEKGSHEISFDNPTKNNLILAPLEETILSTEGNEEVIYKLPFKKFDTYSTYELYFEYFIDKGYGPIVAVEQDSDEFSESKIVHRIQSVLIKNEYNYGWKQHASSFKLFPNTREAVLTFKVPAWGDCKAVVKMSYKKYCKDEVFRKKFLKDSQVRIRNIRIDRVFTNSVVIRKETTLVNSPRPPEISFKEISPALYKIEIKNAGNPFFLNLSTAYDPNWKAYEGRSMISEENHVISNGYSNGWFIDKKGNYSLTLEYLPDRTYRFAQIISVIVGGLYIFIILLRLKKND